MPDQADLQAIKQAAANDVPEAYRHVVTADVSEDGLAAVALVLLNPEDEPYPVLSFLWRLDGWEEDILTEVSAPAVNWVTGRWVSYAAGPAPKNARHVRVWHHAEQVSLVPVVEGYYLSVYWCPPSEPDEVLPPSAPRVAGFGS